MIQWYQIQFYEHFKDQLIFESYQILCETHLKICKSNYKRTNPSLTSGIEVLFDRIEMII
jgi:hypothetical protein